jgi:Tn3 transposase DDE domain
MLALHLLQNCMVYINTVMMQQVLARPHWAERLTATDMRALTPLIWEHVNPYGRFELNMETRLDLSDGIYSFSRSHRICRRASLRL